MQDEAWSKIAYPPRAPNRNTRARSACARSPCSARARRVRGVRCRKGELESRPAAPTVARGYRPAVRLNDRAADREAEAGSDDRVLLAAALKLVEQSRRIAGRQAGTLIVDRH